MMCIGPGFAPTGHGAGQDRPETGLSCLACGDVDLMPSEITAGVCHDCVPVEVNR